MKKILYILLFRPLAIFGQDNYSLGFDGVDDYVVINGVGLNLNDFSFKASRMLRKKISHDFWFFSSRKSTTLPFLTV